MIPNGHPETNLADNALPESFLDESGWEYEDVLLERKRLMAARIRSCYESF